MSQPSSDNPVSDMEVVEKPENELGRELHEIMGEVERLSASASASCAATRSLILKLKSSVMAAEDDAEAAPSLLACWLAALLEAEERRSTR